MRSRRSPGEANSVDRLHAYLLQIQDQVLPKSEAGQAVAYTLKNWTALPRYCADADLPIDNTEQKDPYAASPWGAATGPFSAATAAERPLPCSAVSLIKVDPFAWFRDVLSRIADHPVTELDDLLPLVGPPPLAKSPNIF